MASYLFEVATSEPIDGMKENQHELRIGIYIMEVNQKAATEGNSYEYASADLSVSCQA